MSEAEGGIPWWVRPGQAVECVDDEGDSHPEVTWSIVKGKCYHVNRAERARLQFLRRDGTIVDGPLMPSISLAEDPNRAKFSYEVKRFRPLFPVQMEKIKREALGLPAREREGVQ